MLCKTLRFVVISCLVAIGLAYATGGVMTGSGTEADPYLVADYADLKAVGVTYSLDSVYRLIADIDASASATEHGDSGFVPIGDSVNRFNGIFHGAGYTINGLHIKRDSARGVGLFGYIHSAIIDSVILVDDTINGGYFYVGGIAGYSDSSFISNCNNSGVVSGTYNIGSIVGYNTSSTISNCYNTGNISTSNAFVGGIAGQNRSGSTIDHCRNTGCVSGSTHSTFGIGGVTGNNDSSIISFCSNTGSVSGSSGLVSGIAGINDGTISNCSNTGSISGMGYVGGIVGENFAVISNCYNTGNVSGSGFYIGGIAGMSIGGGISTSSYNTGSISGDRYVGGIIGYNSSSTIFYCYNTGIISGSDSSDCIGGIAGQSGGGVSSSAEISHGYNIGFVQGTTNTGGIVGGGNSYTALLSCYWDTMTTGQDSAWGSNSGTVNSVFGLPTAMMKLPGSFGGWDFDTGWVIWSDSTCPSLPAIDNAPFAFTDTFVSGRMFSLWKFLLNDCDFETGHTSLVLRVDSVSTGTSDSGAYWYPAGALQGDTARVRYRVGEIRAEDTLWGNMAWGVLILDTALPNAVKPRQDPAGLKLLSFKSSSCPFSTSGVVTVSFTLPSNSLVSLKIFDLRGREVVTLVSHERLAAGSYTRTWNTAAASGIYFCRLKAGAAMLTKKIWH